MASQPPIDSEVRDILTRPIAGPSSRMGRSVITGNPAEGLTPDMLAVILRAAEDGDAEAYLELAEQMEERDLHYLSVLGTRKRQVSQLPIVIDAASDDAADQAVADFCREWLARDTLETELFDILDAVGKGFSFTEIIWKLDGGRWWPDRLEWRDPRWFEFARADGTTPLLKGDYGKERHAGGQRMPLPPHKFIQHVHPAKSGLKIRGGFARPVAWAWLFKNYSLKDWVSFAEIYGLPFRVGRYDAGASEDDIWKLMQAVANIGSDAAAVMPKSMEVQFIDGKASGDAELWQRLCDYLDRQVSKAVLGQTATTDADTGGLGSGKEHGEVRADIERADAKLLAASLQRDLIAPMVRFNFGNGVAMPKIRIGREEAHDTAAMASALAQLVPVGLKVGMSTVRDRLGFPDPEPGEEVLAVNPATPQIPPSGAQQAPTGPTMPASAAPHLLQPLRGRYGGISGTASSSWPRIPSAALLAAAVGQAIGAETDAIDAAAAAIASEQGMAILAPIIEPMLAALARGESFEQAAAILDQVAGAMDERELEQAIERAVIASRMAGVSGQ